MRARAYRVLCGGLGGLWIVGGLVLVSFFFRFHSAGFRGEQPELPLPLDAWGVYMAAMAGCAMVAWGGGLLGAARRGADGGSIGTASALALSLMALYRIVGWVVGEYPAAADALRVEAVVFLLLALAFVWLRPQRPAAAAA